MRNFLGVGALFETRITAPTRCACSCEGGWRAGIDHQVALLERFDRLIALAVFTSGESAADGRATEAGIASRVLAD